MGNAPRATTLAPFQFRAFRFQWPADLATSCAFEMEAIILSWYILVETQSVFLLSVYASLQYLGTLISPMLGVFGDRLGPRYLLSAMRAIYSTLALTLLTIITLGVLSPVYVFIVSACMGLVRPSDMGMRVMLVGDIVPSTHFVGAIGIQRTTMDSARVGGALVGAALVAALGMTAAYVVIASLYMTSTFLTLQARREHGQRPAAPQPAVPTARPSPWRDLKEGARYVWTSPVLFATMCLAFVINMTAFPLINGLQPYVAKEIYGIGQTGLAYMVSAAGAGALVGSLVASRYGNVRPARLMISGCVAWFVCLLVYSHTTHLAAGLPFLFFAGFCASMSQVPMQAMLLHQTSEQFRGRVMGLRMLAIYGNMIGLLSAGPLIASIGYAWTASSYCIFGISFAVFAATYWHSHVWRRDAPANRR